jgi:hypothetical protein
MPEAIAAIGQPHGAEFDSPGNLPGRLPDRQQPAMVLPTTAPRQNASMKRFETTQSCFQRISYSG